MCSNYKLFANSQNNSNNFFPIYKTLCCRPNDITEQNQNYTEMYLPVVYVLLVIKKV